MEFRAANPFRLKKTVDSEKKLCIYYTEGFEEIPIQLRILAGEVVTHLRSALDQMIWQLSLKFTSTPATNTQFPICETRKDFEKRGAAQTACLSDELQQIIRDLQPFNDKTPPHHWLWVLNRLANDDKHRFITIGTTSTTGLGATDLIDGMAIQTRLGPITNGCELFRIDFSNCAGEFEKNLEHEANPKIFLSMCLELENNPILLPAIPTLVQLGKSVENVARIFEPFFAENSGF
nr:hypothetical protein [uncultured Duganella sp.]